MFLRFGVENFLSFKDYAEVSFVSTARRDEPAWRFPAAGIPHGILPAVGLWGANASGKSNMLSALMTLRDHVANSFTKTRPDQPVAWTPWQMRRDGQAPPTTLDLDLLVEGVRHHYGFRLAASGFSEEWLFAWPDSRKRVLFHRNHRDPDPWYLGPSLRGQRRLLVDATRPNSLFLSTAAQHNHELLGRIYKAIVSGIESDNPIELRGYPLFFPDDPILDPALRTTLLRLVDAMDIGVVGLRELERPNAADEIRMHLSTVLQQEPLEELLSGIGRRGPLRELRLLHGESRECGWELDSRFESRGTWILLSRLNDLLGLLRRGGLIVLDEIDTSLHPDLCGALVDLFTSPQSNPRGAQLLFTTHDRGLLGRLRTDEVVLVDKGRDGVSRLRCSSDYKDVRSREDLRRAHEQGRLRGVPVLGDLVRLVAEEMHCDS